jgi:hypothetical protein
VYETYYKGKRDLLWRQKRHTTMLQKHVRQPRLHEAVARETADWRAACVSQPSCLEHSNVGVHRAPAPRALAAALTRVKRGFNRGGTARDMAHLQVEQEATARNRAFAGESYRRHVTVRNASRLSSLPLGQLLHSSPAFCSEVHCS